MSHKEDLCTYCSITGMKQDMQSAHLIVGDDKIDAFPVYSGIMWQLALV